MEKNEYLNKFYKSYPFLKGMTDDLLFFVAIDTLFYTVVKGLSAQQIIFITTISSFFSILFRATLIKIIRKIGNTKSVRVGIGLLLLSSLILTFGPSYIWMIIARIIYECGFVFKDMEEVMLKNNLAINGKSNNYAKIANKGMVIYAFATTVIAFSSGFLFNANPYLPMYLCILICLSCFILYGKMMKDISSNDIIKEEKIYKTKKVKLSKMIWIILISYAVFFGVIVQGQYNTKLLIQYGLSNVYENIKVPIYLGVIVSASRISRLLANIFFGKVYYKLKNKSLIILTSFLFIAFLFIITGYFTPVITLRFTLMAIGFCIILAIRDPFRLYTNDLVLKISKPEQQQVVVAYVQLAKKLGTTSLSLLVSAALLKWKMIYVICGLGIFAFAEFLIGLKLYAMLGENSKEEI